MDIGDELIFVDSSNGEKKFLIKPKLRAEGHGGGDKGLTEGFVNSLQPEYSLVPLTEARASLESHLMAFAAEQSRIEYRVVDMEKFHSLI
jgi:hypothetical protein